MPVAEARALVGEDVLLGRSTHTPAQVDDAAVADVDYFAVGPVHATPTKPGRPAVGLELVRHAASAPRRCRGSRSAGSTRRTSARSSPRARRGSSSCAR